MIAKNLRRLLSVIPYEDVKTRWHLNAQPRPLAMYWFDNDASAPKWH